MSFNEIVDTLNRQGHTFSFTQVPAEIRVNAVAFGTIQTPMIVRMVGEAQTDDAQRDWLAGLHPIGRIGTTEEAAQAVIALLENPFITGSILTVDGGWTAQ